jgi:hypothetical protein
MTLEIETDSKCLQDTLTSNDWDDSHDGLIIRELKFLILSCFNNVMMLFAPRMCNKVAHHLATIGSDSQELIWLYNFPDIVSDLVASDLMLCEG